LGENQTDEVNTSNSKTDVNDIQKFGSYFLQENMLRAYYEVETSNDIKTLKLLILKTSWN